VHFAQVDRHVVLCGKRLRASRHSALHSPGVTDLLNASLHRGPNFLRQDTQRDPTSPAPSSTFSRTRGISTNGTNGTDGTAQITHASENLFLFGTSQGDGRHHDRRSPTFSTRTQTGTFPMVDCQGVGSDFVTVTVTDKVCFPTLTMTTTTTTTTTGLFSRFLSGLITGTPNTTRTQQRRH
jgi:hypothetical protein